MNPTLDNPPGVFVQPGPDTQPMTLAEHVDGILALVGADRTIDPSEQGELMRLQQGLQMIGMAKQAAAQPSPDEGPSDETSAFGATDGTEDAQNSSPPDGQEYAGSGY